LIIAARESSKHIAAKISLRDSQCGSQTTRVERCESNRLQIFCTRIRFEIARDLL